MAASSALGSLCSVATARARGLGDGERGGAATSGTAEGEGHGDGDARGVAAPAASDSARLSPLSTAYIGDVEHAVVTMAVAWICATASSVSWISDRLGTVAIVNASLLLAPSHSSTCSKNDRVTLHVRVSTLVNF